MNTLKGLVELMFYFVIFCAGVGGFEWAFAKSVCYLFEGDAAFYPIIAMAGSINFICALGIYNSVRTPPKTKKKLKLKRSDP